MKKVGFTLLALVIVVIALSGIFHIILLGLGASAVFALGYGTGKTTERIHGRERRHLR